tara:strand:+ start:269 stop:556 length:288 start_codon:yes stop_codon:yes gene_type:complete
MKKFSPIYLIMLWFISTSSALAYVQDNDLSKIVSASHYNALKDLENSNNSIDLIGELKPLYKVFSMEVSNSVGAGDIFEVGASLNLELHYRRRDL